MRDKKRLLSCWEKHHNGSRQVSEEDGKTDRLLVSILKLEKDFFEEVVSSQVHAK